MKIIVKLEASQNSCSHTLDLEDLNLSEEEWDKLTHEDKIEAVKQAIYDLPDQPFWELDSYQVR